MTIQRGEIYFVNLNPVQGREETGFLLRNCWGKLDIDRNPVSQGNAIAIDKFIQTISRK